MANIFTRILRVLLVLFFYLMLKALFAGVRALLAAIPELEPANARRPKKRPQRKREPEQGIRHSTATSTNAARQKSVVVKAFSQTLPVELWSRIFELATYVTGCLPTSETHSPNTITPYHLSSTYDDDTDIQAKLRKMQQMKFQLLFMCKDWLDFALRNLYRELHIGSSQALFCLADRLSSVGKSDLDVNFGRFVLRLDIAMRDKGDNDAVASAPAEDIGPGAQTSSSCHKASVSGRSTLQPIPQLADGAIAYGKGFFLRLLPASLLSPRLPSLCLVSSFYPITFLATESQREITLVGRIYVVPLKAELGICADVSVNNSSADQSVLPSRHLSIVDYSDKLVPQMLTLKQIQRQKISSIELTDIFGECLVQPPGNMHSHLETMLEYVKTRLPTVQNINLMFPCYARKVGHPIDFWERETAITPYPLKTLGFHFPRHYKKDYILSALFTIANHVLQNSPSMERILILDKNTSLLVQGHHKLMHGLLLWYPRVRVEDWQGKQLVFRR